MKNRVDIEFLIARIDVVLPQTQCGQCSYPGCKPYATALATGEADINQCPPGGDAGIHALAQVLGVNYQPLNPHYGVWKPRAVALINEADCIGCTLCIQACPVDAILGASKHMHTVIGAECTGCELCVAPCPVDCISMEPVSTADQQMYSPDTAISARAPARAAADVARKRHELRLTRIEREKQERARLRAVRHAGLATNVAGVTHTDTAKKMAIAAAMARAKAQKAGIKPQNTDHLSSEAQAVIEGIETRRTARLASRSVPETAPNTGAGSVLRNNAEEKR